MRDSHWQEGLARPFSTLIRVIELMIIGLTGGMGCGKSTAARLFSDRGFRRLDSDQVVRDEVLTDPAVVAALRAQWGEAVAPGGVVDRGVVADRAFADDAARLWLESVIHPRVYARWRQVLAESPGASWVFEVPLLFEQGLENWFDFIVCVTTSSAQQIARLEERGISQALARQRISKQLPLAQKVEQADYVLLNDGSVEFLRAQVDRLLAAPVFTAVR